MLNVKNKKILVAGGGRSGKAVAFFLRNKGAVVAVSDKRKIIPPRGVKFINEEKVEGLLNDFDMLVLSPGVSPGLRFVKAAKKMKLAVAGEFEFSYGFIPRGVKKILITGTNGKSTVTALIHKILTGSGVNAVLGGNIGTPLSELLKNLSGQETLVIETSSFNLERHTGKENFAADVRVLLNITPDHLSRYKNFRDYARIKKSIFNGIRDSDTGIAGYGCKIRKSNAAGLRGVRPERIFTIGGDLRFKGARIVLSPNFKKRFPYADEVCVQPSKMKLIFEANRENILASFAAAIHFKVPPRAFLEALYKFKPLAHRMEYAGSFRGRIFVNDSKSTNVSSVEFALKNTRRPHVLIMGGRDKGSPYTILGKYLKNTRVIIAYGESGKKIKCELSEFKRVKTVERFSEACELALSESAEGDVILLSPGCASYDQFANFEERGSAFKKWVRKLT